MRVSFLISTRQHGRLVSACLESVFAQTVPADEVIVAGNGSTDETPWLALERHRGNALEQ